MAEYADALVAVWDGKSTGTGNMIQTMKDVGKPTYVYRTDQPNDATDILVRLRAAGFTLREQAGAVMVTPASKLTMDQRAEITANKPALLVLLRGSPPEIDDFDRQVDAHIRSWGPPPWQVTPAHTGSIGPPCPGCVWCKTFAELRKLKIPIPGD